MTSPVLRIIFDHALVGQVALDGPVTLGRADDNVVVLDDDAVSAHHGRVALEGDAWVYTDVGSRNGSLVAAGPTLHAGESVALDDLVQIKLGDTVLEFLPGDGATPAPAGASTRSAATGSPAAAVLGAVDSPARAATTVGTDRDAPAPPVHGTQPTTTTGGLGPAPPLLDELHRSGMPSTRRFDALDELEPEQRRVDGGQLRPRLVVVQDQMTFTATLSVPVAVLGRAPRCDVVIDSPSVSARHAEIRWDGRGFTIEDLGSTNGTRLSLARLRRPTPLPNGSHVILGDVDLLFVHDPAGGSLDGERIELEPEGFLRWLRERRKLSREQAQAALESCRAESRSLEEVLVADGYLSPGAVTELRHNAAQRQQSRADGGSSPRGAPSRAVSLALIVVALAVAAAALVLLT